MRPKTIAESAVTMCHLMLPQDANPAGSIHGGVIMKHIDTAGGVAAIRHVRGNAVTASIDRLDFHIPAKIGELLILKASVNGVGRRSLEVGVRVETEDLFTGDLRHCASAYLTFVALNQEGHPTGVPPLQPETHDERRRMREANERREARLGGKKG
ncbi:acyl-CoA thioesterase [Desulfohalobium retbaense]|jgi:uncharacterized protein (TIGR00369 family)|uniref:Thioesterase superfamily protein n=1 Tax=Desulfohalobium retbaense (strain ATCC 49708 / DSM 5692 / JCM 16813 / HR100) TaxID=485915 RepID=C8X0N9_DESRD|nr:acyl-CoA thioesterase [Desulfohalobium retbaense]ACV67986.1 thioesterase superfamily protein [Desulfohalobium retbaense DSM 5692]